MAHVPPQPHPSRLTDFAGHPLVVSMLPHQPELVALTAASLGRAIRSPTLYFAYVDTSRYTVEEHPDGTVRHASIDPDIVDTEWEATAASLTASVAAAMREQDISWQFRYLAGRVDRSLTHLARAVDAAAIIVAAHIGHHHHLRDFLNGSVSVQLAHRQHRPVIVVPLQVVDWEGRAPWE